MKVLFLSECPGVTTSLGKVSMYLASGLAELGFDVAVAPYSYSIIPSLVSFERRFSPCVQAKQHGDPLADLYPCGEVRVHPWGKLYPIADIADVHSSDVLFVYSYPYAELDLNDIAYRFFTSRGKPSIVYALHEGPVLEPELSMSLLAHSVVASPTRSIMEKYLNGLAEATGADRGDAEPYFTVLHHPLPASLYSSSASSVLLEYYGAPVIKHDCVIGMIAKNHIRKDYAGLLEAVVRARVQTGLDIAAGLYWIDAVSNNYWKKHELVKRVSRKLGVPQEEVEDSVVMLPDKWRVLGLTESFIMHVYLHYMDMHLFMTRGESYGLPPVESSLLGVPTATTGIPEQVEIFGEKMRYVKASLLERDEYVLYSPDPADASSAIIEFTEGKLPPPDRDRLASMHDYRIIAKKLAEIIDSAVESPRPLSSKLPLKRR